MSTVIDLFERHGYVLELLACVAATTWKLEWQERFAVRLTGILLAEACFTIVWEQVPHNLYTESLRTFLLWSIAAVGIRLCFRIAAAWAVFYATAAGTMQHIIYRGAKLLQNAVYHMDRQYWAWSRWVYLGLFVLLFAVCCLTLTRRLHSRNLGTLPGRTMTFIMVGYQLSMNIFVNLFNAFSVDSAPRIFTVYSVYDEVTTILLFFLLCEILQRSDAEWDNMGLQQMMRQQRQQMEQAKVEAERLRMETEKQKEKSDEYYAQIKAERDKAVQQARKEAQYIIEDARRTANNVYEELKQLRKQARDGAFVEGSNEKQAALRRSLNEAEGKLREKQEVRQRPAASRAIRVGDTVELLKFGSKATVLAINKDGSYQLQAGIMKVNAKPDEVYLLENETQAKAKKLMEGKVRDLKSAAQPELDIRGMAVDEALPVLDNFLDAAYMGNLPNARIIHGKGTGVLRKAVQDELRRCKYVKSFRLGVYGEGEDGVTIAEFK